MRAKIALKLLCLILMSFCLVTVWPQESYSQTASGWPVLGHDAQHTGLSLAAGPKELVAPQIIDLPASLPSTGSIAIDDNGVLYVSTIGMASSTEFQSKLYAINPDGSVRDGWPFAGPVGNQYVVTYTTSPAIGPDGTIYCAFGGSLYALNPNGTPKWLSPFVTGDVIFASPVVAPDNSIYLVSSDGYLYSINPNGTEKWRLYGVHSTPAIGKNGLVYAEGGPSLTMTGGLSAINPDGSIKWEYNLGGTFMAPVFVSTPVVAPNGLVYAVVGSLYTYTTRIVAIDPEIAGITYQTSMTGSSFAGNEFLPLSIAPDGTILCLSDNLSATDTRLVRFTEDLSSTLLEYPLAPYGPATPLAVGTGGIVYLAADGPGETSKIIALAQDGSTKSTFITDIGRHGPAAIAPNGTVYFGGGNSLYSFRVPQYSYPVEGISYSSCPVDSGTNFDPDNPATWFTMVWTGRYSGNADSRCEGTGGHPGVDIVPRTEAAYQIRAMASGTVIEKNFLSGYGNYVIIEHKDLPVYGTVYSLYMHLASVDAAIEEGNSVEARQQIGLMGATGGRYGVHLHFQIDIALNPVRNKKGIVQYYKPFWPQYTSGRNHADYPTDQAKESRLTDVQLKEAADNVRANTLNPVLVVKTLRGE
jgi:murein DD-endopeptidase MepM/ murein hydrolase activator NlpD